MISEITIQVLFVDKIYSKDFKLQCGCQLVEIKANRVEQAKSFIDSIRTPLIRDHANVKLDSLKKFVFFLKLIVKRPDFFNFNKIRQKSFKLPIKANSHLHELHFENFWVSDELSQFGFANIMDPLENSLNAVRRKIYRGYLFMSNTEGNNYCNQSTKYSIDLTNFSSEALPQKYFLGKWAHTSFFEIVNAESLFGLCALNQKSNSIYFFNLSDHSNLFSQHLLNRPKSVKYFNGRAVLVAFSNNYYHFLAEGLQPLIFCIQNRIDFSYIIVREDAPQNFIDILNILAPGKLIVRQKPEERYSFSKLVMAQTVSTFAQIRDAFRPSADISFSDFDEYQVLKFCRDFFSILEEEATEKILISNRKKEESRGFLFFWVLKFTSKFFNFTVTDLAFSRFEHLLYELKRTKIFICESGAGMLNFIFLPSNSIVIEVQYGNGESWEPILRNFPQRYYPISISRFQYSLWGKWLDVFIYPFVKVLRQVLRES